MALAWMSSLRPMRTRPSFRRMTVPAAVVVTIVAAFTAGRQWERVRARVSARTKAESRQTHDTRPGARMIEEKYRIQVAWKDQAYPAETFHALIEATNAEPGDADNYCELLANEFLIYPPSLIRVCRLKRIVLCSGLAVGGQSRAAVPDFEHGALYLDVLRGGYSRYYQRLVIHHRRYPSSGRTKARRG